MAKKIFVSYNFNDREVRQSVKEMIENQDIEGRIVFVENDVSYNGATAIDWEIEHTMERCDAALFVIGDHVRNSPWIEREAALAIAKEIPVVATCLPGTDGECPTELSAMPILNWGSESLAETLNQY